MQRRHFLQAASFATFASALPTWAQPKATKLLVGAPPGGGTDILARAIGNEMSKHLSRNFIVENRPGAGGNIAAMGTSQAPADGSTLLLSYTSHVINPSLYKKLPFDPINDFTPIAPIATAPSILLVSPQCPANNLQELIALAKSKPGTLNVAIAGLGGANHLAGEMLRKQANIDVLGIPYKGTAGALGDLMANHVDIVFSGYGAAGPLIKAGKVKALAVTSAQPLISLPNVPPIANDLPNFDYSAWYGIFGPAGLPAQDVEALRTAVAASLKAPAITQQLDREGMTPLTMNGDEFTQFVMAEVQRWKQAVEISGVELL